MSPKRKGLRSMCRRMAQQPRADQAHRHHHRRAEENRRLRCAVGKAIAVDHRPDRLAEIEEARMQGCGRPARGLRELGDMDLDAAVQEVEPKSKHAVDGDLPKPWEMQRDEDKTGRSQRTAGAEYPAGYTMYGALVVVGIAVEITGAPAVTVVLGVLGAFT